MATIVIQMLNGPAVVIPFNNTNWDGLASNLGYALKGADVAHVNRYVYEDGNGQTQRQLVVLDHVVSAKVVD